MKLIKPSFLIKEQEPGVIGIYRQIEYAGRICYKSSNKITEDSAKPFVDRMIKSGHGAMLEHGTVYLDVPNSAGNYNLVPFFASNPYSKIVIKPLNDRVHNYITTNFRVIVENFAEEYIPDVLQYICEPTKSHEKRVTVRFICDRGVSHEYVRHRVFSFAQESTRYCNYSKDKFNNELTFIQPVWTYHQEDGDYGTLGTPKRKNGGNKDGTFYEFIKSLQYAELYYFRLLQEGWIPQQARAVLPSALKTELVMTGFVSDWKHFFRLRSRIAETGKPHPQAQELADPLMDEFVKRGIMETLL